MRRPVVLSSLLTLFVVAGVGLIEGSFLLQPATAPVAASGNTDVIRRFYAAANETIATGDTTALHDVVAPHFVDQDPIPGMNPDRGGLEGYLSALHALVPDTELLVEAVVAGGDRAMARVAVRGGQGPTPLRDAVVDQPVPWGPVDVFRIAGGKVVERWSQTDDLTLVRPVTEATIDLPSPSPRVVSLDRMTFEPDAVWKPSPAGPRLIFLESGALRLEIATPEPEPGTLPAGRCSQGAGGARLAMPNAGGGEGWVLGASFYDPCLTDREPTENI